MLFCTLRISPHVREYNVFMKTETAIIRFTIDFDKQNVTIGIGSISPPPIEDHKF